MTFYGLLAIRSDLRAVEDRFAALERNETPTLSALDWEIVDRLLRIYVPKLCDEVQQSQRFVQTLERSIDELEEMVSKERGKLARRPTLDEVREALWAADTPIFNCRDAVSAVTALYDAKEASSGIGIAAAQANLAGDVAGTMTMLLLVLEEAECEKLTMEHLLPWTEAQRVQAGQWAFSVHAAASDNDVPARDLMEPYHVTALRQQLRAT